jgi:hypothetical protein
LPPKPSKKNNKNEEEGSGVKLVDYVDEQEDKSKAKSNLPFWAAPSPIDGE